MNQNGNKQLAQATLGGGCFWCLEAVYELIDGIDSVVSGYAAGHVPNPTYQAVCAGTTGHAEVVQLTYDPAVVTYDDLLDLFFTIHDPTTLNRQGNDVGTQYRSIILTHDDAQRAVAERKIAELDASDLWPNPLVTQIEPLETFYPAEEYHQSYYRNNKLQPYCQFVVRPKVAKARRKFVDKLKA